MTLSPLPEPLDSERAAAQSRLEVAVGEGRLTLDEFTERCSRVWSATDKTAIARTLDDLPVEVVGQRQKATSVLVGVFGDIKRRGRWAVRERVSAFLLFGDVELDLRGAVVRGDELTIRVYTIFGDAQVVVPEGVDVEMGGFSLFGDEETKLAPVERVRGTPLVRVRQFSIFGDLEVRSAR
ncbi:DUF1707 SHOCT-like domain-containing protein [Pseudonocardia sp. TRM90224]|uniref:DUF1707 SHOCT-like domain-containing protein n=1 Tax=Pseudonocardia sp. TRM90224 TaxID=2812678 RepID=UPI001E29E4AE|nr:DUF1707 domain-containing protein [Pseudonocardia sp. TRM90224]